MARTYISAASTGFSGCSVAMDSPSLMFSPMPALSVRTTMPDCGARTTYSPRRTATLLILFCNTATSPSELARLDTAELRSDCVLARFSWYLARISLSAIPALASACRLLASLLRCEVTLAKSSWSFRRRVSMSVSENRPFW